MTKNPSAAAADIPFSEACQLLGGVLRSLGTWEWDDWFKVAQCTLPKSEEGRLLEALGTVLPCRWEQGDTNVLNSWPFRVSQRIGGLSHGQTLYTSQAGDAAVLFAALWPWGDNQQLSLRIGLHELEADEMRAAALDDAVRGCFGL